MNNFFGTQYSQEDLQNRVAQRRAQNVPSRASSVSMVPTAPGPQLNDGTIDMTGMVGGGDSLDDIIMQNNNEMRRQSLPQGYGTQDIDRRASMMEFGSVNGSLNGFQFGQSTAAPGEPSIRRQSAGELDIAGGFPDMSNISRAMSLAGQPMGFSSPMQAQGALTINTNSPFSQIPTDMMGNMMGYAPMGMEAMPEGDPSVMNTNAMNMFSPTQFPPQYGPPSMEPMGTDFMMQPNMVQTLSPRRNSMQIETNNDGLPTITSIPITDGPTIGSPTNMNVNQNMVAYSSPVATSMPQTLPTPDSSLNASLPPDQANVVSQPTEFGPPKLPEPKKPNYNGIYSASGFDMLGALMKVATRKNPEIEIGKVDLSCAFVVCDITQYDCPIIYISDIFERLTGYNKHEIKGQNCRFLQSPEGKVEVGAKRDFVDNNSVYYLKNRIAEKKEAQRSLINYRKGGQPFMNLLTMIPITGEDNLEIKYFVGFQVDVLAKPTSLEGTTTGGHYTVVDYSQSSLPRYIWQRPEGMRSGSEGGPTVSRDDVSTVLNAVNTNTESELTRRMWDKVLLENTDDVVHVLSLKGLFLYLSPSSRHVLEYDASELVGTALSSVCHPSDIVPVTRELKDTSTGASVNVVFRIRRKKSGYTWFESHGSLCVEQGKGRKCIILVGRERPVYALHRHDIDAAGGIGDSEMWTKLSTSGMFLFVSSNVRTLLDRSPDDLIGTSVQALMRAESRVEFGRALERARTGKRITHKHDILNRKGLVLQAQTTLYPGDASEGQKPTFLVAQTRLLKSSSRTVAPALNANTNASATSPMPRMDHLSEDGTPISHPSTLSNHLSMNQDIAATSKSTPSIHGPISQAGGSGLPIGTQDLALASEDNIFDELKTTRCTSWQFELRQMEKSNRLLAEELAGLLSNKKKRKRRKGNGNPTRDCANCHTRTTPEWRRGPSGQRDLCNSCGLRWAKQTGRVSPRNSTRGGDTSNSKQSHSASPVHSSPLQQEASKSSDPQRTNTNADSNGNGDMKGDGAAVPGSLGGRTTIESMPVHRPSVGFREGGERGITKIDERDERVS
ncbi:hypothetical protein EG329_004980 [Mollisiaceae sp. DMI_Dod_QoI]|nr:hypothetical protein EG329_004980 [Helotiales sp. DMI_Dod_QoI]